MKCSSALEIFAAAFAGFTNALKWDVKTLETRTSLDVADQQATIILRRR